MKTNKEILEDQIYSVLQDIKHCTETTSIPFMRWYVDLHTHNDKPIGLKSMGTLEAEIEELREVVHDLDKHNQKLIELLDEYKELENDNEK